MGEKIEGMEDELVAHLRRVRQPITNAARELIVLELYRQAVISSGKAAELLGMGRKEFIQYSSRLGIPFFRMTREQWETERARSEEL